MRTSITAILLFLCCVLARPIQGQVHIDTSALSNDIFGLVTGAMEGGGVTTSNPSYGGHSLEQIAHFYDTLGSIGFHKGTIMCTGFVEVAEGSNTTGNATNPSGGWGYTPDVDVATLSGQVLNNDLVALEFIVVPYGDSLFIDFVFASEEYPENVCSSVSDVMGIVISGPGINGPYSGFGDLMSIVPGSIDPVGINSINAGTVGQNGQQGGCGTNGLNNDQFFNINTAGLHEFDGYTIPLTATYPVQCLQPYRIKLVVADIDNEMAESALFIRDGGVYSNGLTAKAKGLMGDTAIVEGCLPDTIFFESPLGGTPQSIDITVGGSATPGTDYQQIPSNITFNNSDTLDYIVLQAFDDGLTENPESITIEFWTLTTCGDSVFNEFEIWILDPNPMIVDFDEELSTCIGNAVTLTASVTGGYPGYFYYWGTMGGNNLTYYPDQDTTLTLSIYDQAGCVVQEQVSIEVVPAPTIDAGPNMWICRNSSAQMQVTVGGNADATYSWYPTSFLDDPTIANPTVIEPDWPTQYVVTAQTADGCVVSDTVMVTTLAPPNLTMSADQEILYGQDSVLICATTSPSNSVIWWPSSSVGCDTCFCTMALPDQTTEYHVSVYGQNGCKAEGSVLVEVDVPTEVFVPTAFSPNGDGINDTMYVRGYTIEEVVFRIYDRQGHVVFESNDLDRGWDGTTDGMPAQPGIYVYSAYVEFVNDAGAKEVAGEFTLVR